MDMNPKQRFKFNGCQSETVLLWNGLFVLIFKGKRPRDGYFLESLNILINAVLSLYALMISNHFKSFSLWYPLSNNNLFIWFFEISYYLLILQMLTETLLRIPPGYRYYFIGLQAVSCMYFFRVKTAAQGSLKRVTGTEGICKISKQFQRCKLKLWFFNNKVTKTVTGSAWTKSTY